jgi:hypothetical protein
VRYAARRDNSHRSIAEALEAAGATVLEGFDCDIYCRFRDRSWLIECKNRERVEAKRTGGHRKGSVRPKQVELKAIFGSSYVIAYDAREALLAIGAIAL